MSAARDLHSLLSEVRTMFTQAGIVDVSSDARTLVAGVIGLNGTELITRDRDIVSSDNVERVLAAARRRLNGEPVHRILGQREFYGMTFALSPETLEPRPDTEVLVDTLLELLQGRQGPLRILDMGTGTGIICISLLANLPNSTGIALDISADAVATARRNAAENGVGERLDVRLSNWFDNVTGRFDVIVSNPPYIASAHIADLDREVREFDPTAALDGGADGLAAYRAIARSAGQFLAPEGIVGLEIGWDQRLSVTRLFEENGFRLLAEARDYGGQDRVLVFCQ